MEDTAAMVYLWAVLVFTPVNLASIPQNFLCVCPCNAFPAVLWRTLLPPATSGGGGENRLPHNPGSKRLARLGDHFGRAA